MTPVSQIVWKNRHLLGDHGSILMVRPPADELAARLMGEGHAPEALCHSMATHEHLAARSIQTHFGVATMDQASCPSIILFQPREKPLLDMMLALCSTWLAKGGKLWLAGENRSGIRSAGKRLPGHFENFRKIDSARHCVLLQADTPLRPGATAPGDFLEEWKLETGGAELTVCSLPGVFAHGHLDPGSQLLIETLAPGHAPSPIRGRVLDFACGAGVIGLALSSLNPGVELVMLDDSALALEAARCSLEKNSINASLVASNGLTGLLRDGAQPFDWIVSNPPFHTGIEQDLDTTRTFLEDCRQILNPGGRLCLVANVHLPYGRWLQELFGEVQVIASDRGYNVWLARHPASVRGTGH